MPTCTHLDHVQVTELPEAVDGCAACLAPGPWCFVEDVAPIIARVKGHPRIPPSPPGG